MSRMRWARSTVVATMAAAGVLATSAAWAVKVGPVEDPIRVVKIAKGQPLVIGGYFVMSGADSAVGVDQRRGAEIAIDDLGGTFLGHPIKFVVEDSQCNPEGGQLAGTKLAANQQMVVAVGPSCSSEAIAAAPLLWKAGIPNVGVSSSSPKLTEPGRAEGLNGFLRIIFNDGWMAKSVAEYFRNELKLDEVALVHDGSIFGQTLVDNVKKHYEGLGGKVCALEAIAPTDVEMRPMLTRIATCKPKMIYLPVFVAAGGHIARQAKEISGLEGVTLMGQDSMFSRDFITAAGKAVVGFQFATTVFEDEAKGKGYNDMKERYKAKFGEYPVQGFHHYAYDAIMVATKGVEKVAVKDDQGNTYVPIKALRDALFATKNYEGLTGPVTCDQYGDCGRLTLAVYEYVSEDPDKFGIGINPVRKWPAKLQ